MKKLSFLLLACWPWAACQSKSDSTLPVTPDTEIRGADFSYLPDAEKYGFQYKDANGQPADPLLLLKQAGCNTIRLRLWHTPAPEDSYASLAQVSQFSKRVHALGMRVLLTIHYSDHWADPGQQPTPKAWAALPYTTLQDSVYQYTYKAMQAIAPEYVQVGNEINGGLMWPIGALAKKEQMLGLLTSGIQAVRKARPEASIILHHAGMKGSDWFFDQVSGLDYDMIGLSYYPHWHGKDMGALQTQLQTLQQRFSKPVFVAETSYPFTLEWNDWTHNTIGESGLIPAYPATPQGQADYLMALKSAVRAVPKSAGFCYWGAEWVSYKGPKAENASTWENQALFDFQGRTLPATKAFSKE